MWEYFIYTYGSQVLLSILCMLFGGLGLLVRQLAQRYLTDESKRAAAATAVRFAEQVFSDLHGEEKLAKAMEAAALLLKNKRIPFDEKEMRILLEAALQAFHTALQRKQSSLNIGSVLEPDSIHHTSHVQNYNYLLKVFCNYFHHVLFGFRQIVVAVFKDTV